MFLTPSNPDKTAALVAGIEAKLAAAQDAVAEARGEYTKVILAVELGEEDADARTVKAARAALAAAEARAADLQTALDEARRRHTVAQEAAYKAERARRWAEAEQIEQQALAKAAEVEKHAAAMLKARDELAGVLLDFHTVAPEKDNAIGHSRVSRSAVEDALRMHLFKSGELWAWRSWLGNPADAPSLTQRVGDATKLILELRSGGDR